MKFFLLFLIRLYQKYISPLMPPRCRHLPTCSEYAFQAFRTHGFLKALWLTSRRIMRCHPWADPKLDPVPEKKSASGVALTKNDYES